MDLQELEIEGLRGFVRKQGLPLAQPTGSWGSGLTILVGPNNGGKSTVVEALRATSYPSPNDSMQPQSFTEGRRNKNASDRVAIRATYADGSISGLQTVASGGSETEWHPTRPNADLFALPSRRYFSPYFNKGTATRDTYKMYESSNQGRGAPLQSFGYRLFQVQQNRTEFDRILGKVVKPLPNWTIDQSDVGQYYLKVETGGLYHSSEGMGEGLVSLLIIIDALYDSNPGGMVVIDEPELSLHPSLQRRLFSLLCEYAQDRQIVVATHSPYFADIRALINGAKLSRVHLKDGGSTISTVSDPTVQNLAGFLKDRYNPHVLGLNAREAFFLEDRVVLVEGQEDVVLYQRVAEQVGVEIEGDFFGWGVGGAEKMRAIAELLRELGFEKVVGLLDGDKENRREELQEAFPLYRFHTIPAKDIRTKPERLAQPAVKGLLDESGKVRSEHRTPVQELLTQVNGEL